MNAELQPAPPEGRIVVEKRGALQLIGIDRVPKRNGFSERMVIELGEAFDALERNSEVRVGVLHAFGDHFTGGIQLDQLSSWFEAGRHLAPEGSERLVEQEERLVGHEGARQRHPLALAARHFARTAIGKTAQVDGFERIESLAELDHHALAEAVALRNAIDADELERAALLDHDAAFRGSRLELGIHGQSLQDIIES